MCNLQTIRHLACQQFPSCIMAHSVLSRYCIDPQHVHMIGRQVKGSHVAMCAYRTCNIMFHCICVEQTAVTVSPENSL